jgi:uncharacterized damage-inducible protein DinB
MLTTNGKATSDAQEFIDASRVFLKDDFLPKLTLCLKEMSDDDIWWRPNQLSNSAGNLTLHLCGNLRQWILNSMGGAQFVRDRNSEFAERGPVPKADLVSSIESTVMAVDKTLQNLAPDGLLERFSVQGYATTRLQAIYHVVEHFSYHLGQILFIYKMRTGKDPAFYRHLATK